MYTFENKICKKDEKEIWKNCTYPGIKENQYSVSNYGRIKNNDSGKILIPYKLLLILHYFLFLFYLFYTHLLLDSMIHLLNN